MKKQLKRLAVVIAIFLVAFVFLVNNKAHSSDNRFSNSTYKIWAHAGYYEKSSLEKNSIEAFENAINNGAKGTELDVFYDIALKKFIVSHDFPYNKKNGVLLRLDSVFNVIGNRTNYWLDFKNLKRLKPEEVQEAKKILGELMEKNLIHKKNVLLESESVTNIIPFTKDGYYTSWWINPKKTGLKVHLEKFKYKLYYFQGKFSSISMNYEHYDRVDSSLLNIPVNLFTINDEAELLKLNSNSKVQIVLSDKNYFQLKSEIRVKQ